MYLKHHTRKILTGIFICLCVFSIYAGSLSGIAICTGNPTNAEEAVVEHALAGLAEHELALAKITANGTLTDSITNEPLIGAQVIEKGTDNWTLTDENGFFELEVEENAILIFQSFGYLNKEIPALISQSAIILLEPNSFLLDQVLVVGYGTQRKSDLTGAYSSISEEELKAVPVTGIDQAIQGRAAGVYVTQNSGAPGGALSIRVRGIGSTLTAEPLYVIDGIPVINDNASFSTNLSDLEDGGQFSNALNTINPNDIEQIEILKDASATAIYGARGANGVVLITTKRGKKGQSSIKLDTYTGIQSLYKELDIMTLREYAEYYQEVGITQVEEFEYLELLGDGTDWQDEIFQEALTQNYQLSLSGANDQTSFSISAGYNEKEGILIGSDFQRFSGRINIDHKYSDHFRFGNSLLFSKTNERIVFTDNSTSTIYGAVLMLPFIPVRNPDGSFANGATREFSFGAVNPVARALETDDENAKTRVLANMYLEADIFPFLKYRTEIGVDFLLANHSTFLPEITRGLFTTMSGIRKYQSQSTFWVNKHLLTFEKQLSRDHHLTALAGFEAQEARSEYLFASRDNLPNNNQQTINLGNIGQQQNDGSANDWALVSFFGRLNYSFRDQFVIKGTVRTDGSSRFGPSNRYGVFPSAAVAWRISETGFLRNSQFIDNFKIRFGYGAVGNQEIGLYSYLATVRNYNAVVGDRLITAFGPNNIANPDVRWEGSVQANLGLDIGLINNRIEITADAYIKKADGMLLPALLPASAGDLIPPFQNIGEIVNKGIELSVNTVNTTGQFSWRTGVNFTVNRNEVINLGLNGNLIGLLQNLPITRTQEGSPISQFYGYVMEGIFQTQEEVAEAPLQSPATRPGDVRFKDLNNDGVINDQDQTFIGNPFPDFTANLSNSIAYRNFDFSFLLQGVYGNDILNLLRRDGEGFVLNANQLATAVDRFTPNNPSTTIPRAIITDPNNNRRISSRFIEDGSFLRLRNVSLGYTFPLSIIDRIGLEQARIYISGQNLFTITNYSGYDPEIGSFNQNPLINGVDNGRYPTSRSYTFGLNIEF